YTTNLVADQRWQEVVDITDPMPLPKLPNPSRGYLKHVTGIALVHVARDLRSLYAAGYASQVDIEPGSQADPAYLEAKGQKLIKTALELAPDSQVAHVSRLMLAVQQNDIMAARDHARAGWGLGPRDPVWHLYLGLLLAT